MGKIKTSFGSKDSTSTGIIQGSLFGFRFLFLILCATFFFLLLLTPRHYGLFLFVLSSSLLILVRHLSRRCACTDDRFQTISFSLIWAKLTTHHHDHQIENPSLKVVKGGGGGRGSGKSETEEREATLRRRLRRERKKRKEAIKELEREREASAWASQEAMAKIMSLEGDKAQVEREARQYREMAQKQQLHDEEVIHHLQLLLLQSQSLWMEREKAAALDQDSGP